jgi:hypothetical protein
MVGTSPSLKAIGHPWKHSNILSQHFPSLPAITYSNFKVKERTKDGVDHG